jgi:hypothetical protein
MKKLKKFKLVWVTGQTEIIEGNDIWDAFRRAGIGRGALIALDYYDQIYEKEKEVDNA